MRVEKDEFFLQMAELIAKQATCSRRNVGAVLVNKLGHVLSTGFNGTARGFKHCTEEPCAGSLYGSGQGLDKCEAIHAEQNALLQCTDVEDIETCYTTTFPCIHCIKLLLNTGCTRIVYRDDYNHPRAKELWKLANKTELQLNKG